MRREDKMHSIRRLILSEITTVRFRQELSAYEKEDDFLNFIQSHEQKKSGGGFVPLFLLR
jgi:hypothetical protein